MNGRKKRLGFTLVEIMIFAAILGLIVAISIPPIIRWGEEHKSRVHNVEENQ